MIIGNLWSWLGSAGWQEPLTSMLSLAAIVAFDPDAPLIARSRRGDRAAFGDLVQRYQHRVYSICLRWLANEQLADEVAQDVFLAAWRNMAGFREEARFDTWIRKITVNKCKNARLSHHRKARDRHDPIDEEPEDEDAHRVVVASTAAPPDAPLDAARASDILQSALARLRQDQREILVLRDLEDLDYEEIADLLEVPRGTVKSRLHRARLALAAELTPRIGPKDVF